MAKIRATEVPWNEFFNLMERAHLLPDWWRNFNTAAETLHELRMCFEIIKDDERIGLIWLDGAIAGTWPQGAELGAFVFREHRGEWFDQVQLDSLIYTIFEEMGAHRIYSRFTHKRWRGEKFLEKLGFAFEGLERDAEYHRGQAVTMKRMALTKRDWVKMRELGMNRGEYMEYIKDVRDNVGE